MEALHPGMMHHNPYDIVKTEPSDTPPKMMDSSRKTPSLYATQDMLLGVTNFSLQPTFAPSHNNNNHEHLNNNHQRNSNGRSLAADRKRPYPCNICPSRFGSKMELEEHQNSHTGMKPFECDVCKARFNRRSTLWNHKRIHSDAKPFVCTVCQMTFKWKNSLKCHKEMHQRKNESSGILDNDLRQLTYATAAKKKLLENQGGDDHPATSLASSVHSQPLITTTTPKKNKNNNHKAGDWESLGVRRPGTNGLSSLHLNSLAQQPLQASSLIPPSDHHLELDTSQLDTLVNNNHSNMLLHLYGDMEGTGLAPRHAASMLTGLEDNGMLSGLADGKSDSPMGGAPAPINIHMPINILQYRPVTQLPSVHHLTSTSLPSVDYSSSESSNISQPQYIVTAPSDMMLPQGLGYPQQLDQCVILATGQDYMPNFDYNMLQQHYQIAPVEAEQPQHNGQQQNVGGNGQQQPSDDEKVVPYEQW